MNACMVQGLRYKVWGLELSLGLGYGSGFKDKGLGFMI